jgi:hypothetical protein
VDEFLRDKPELRAKIDAKLKNHEWVPAPTQRQVRTRDECLVAAMF